MINLNNYEQVLHEYRLLRNQSTRSQLSINDLEIKNIRLSENFKTLDLKIMAVKNFSH